MYCDVLWYIAMCYDIVGCIMVYYDALWCIMMYYDVLWCILTACCVNFGEDRWGVGRLRCPTLRGETEFWVLRNGAPGFMEQGNKEKTHIMFNQSWFAQSLNIQPLVWWLPADFTMLMHSFEHVMCSSFPVDGPDLFGHGTEIWRLNAVSWDLTQNRSEKWMASGTLRTNHRGDNVKLKGYSSWPKGVSYLEDAAGCLGWCWSRRAWWVEGL